MADSGLQRTVFWDWKYSETASLGPPLRWELRGKVTVIQSRHHAPPCNTQCHQRQYRYLRRWRGSLDFRASCDSPSTELSAAPQSLDGNLSMVSSSCIIIRGPLRTQPCSFEEA